MNGIITNKRKIKMPLGATKQLEAELSGINNISHQFTPYYAIVYIILSQIVRFTSCKHCINYNKSCRKVKES